MHKKILYILIVLVFQGTKSQGQCFTFTIQTIPETCSGCCDGSISVEGLTGGCGPYTFDWIPGSPIGDGTDSIWGLCPGTYIVKIIDDGTCCPDSSVACYLNSPTGISQDANQSAKFEHGTIYPNPANTIAYYEIELSNTETGFVQLFDLLGNMVASQKLNTETNRAEIDLTQFANGVYVYKVIINKEYRDFNKLVITK